MLGERASRRGPRPINDPPTRAFQVGTVSARAIKCGFNFDPAKLKTNYLAYETPARPAPTSRKVERIYDVSFNGVAKAVAGETDYCSRREDARPSRPTSRRHLAGDYTPSPRRRSQQEDGLFSGWGSGGSRQRGHEGQAPRWTTATERARSARRSRHAIRQHSCSSSSGSKRC